MALEKVSHLLKLADERNTAIIAFECSDYNMVYAAAAAAERAGKPVIVMVDPATCYDGRNVSSPEAFAPMARAILESFSVPIGLHLDHSNDYRYIINAIRAGFPSVMFDGSAMALEENMALTRKVVETASVFGVDVEAELGRVGFASDRDEEKNDLFTKPYVARHFVEATGAGSLAVALGNAHGIYASKPHLDLDRLREIDEATDVPLVLHGGSGIPDEQLEKALRMGINKFNVGTEYFQIYYRAIEEFAEERRMDIEWTRKPVFVLDLPSYVQRRMTDYVVRKLELTRL